MKSKRTVKLALLLCAGMQTAHSAQTSILSKIADTFPAAPVTSIQVISSIMSAAFIPSALLAGRLTRTVSKKSVTLAALFFVLIGGLLPYFFHSSIELLMVFSATVGIGIGLISPTVTSLFAESFEGEEHIKALGQQNAAISVGGIAITVLAGALANSAWFNAYLSYLLAVPVIVMAFFLLPRNKPAAATPSGEGGRKPTFSGIALFMAMLAMMSSLSFNAFGTNISLYLSEAGIKDTAVAGIISAVMAAGGFFCGVFFGRISRTFKGFTKSFAFGLMGLLFLVMAFLQDIVAVFTVSFLTGVSNCLFISKASSTLSERLDSRSLTMGIGLFLSFHHIGFFISPIIITGISDWFNGNAAFRFGVGACFALAVAVFLLAYEIISARKRGYPAKNQPLIRA